MALKPFEEVALEPLEFPVGGKIYKLPAYDIPTGLKLTEVLTGKDPEFNKKPVEEIYKLLLGSVWDELLADGASLAAASRCGMTAMAEFQFGRAMAEAAWEAGADPKAMSAYLVRHLPRAQRRSRSTATGNKTQSRGSSNGTRRREA